MAGDNELHRGNPILSVAMGFIEAVAPGGMNEPEKALRKLVPNLRYLVIAPVQTPTTKQMKALRAFREFERSNLLQVRRALQAGEVRLGPFPGDWARATFVPVLIEDGFSVSLEELTAEEKAAHFGFLHDES